MRIAVGTLMASQVVMIGTTSTSPVHLRDHGGSVSTIGLAVGMHLGGMYIASPLSGWLCDRFGRLPVIAGGGVLLLAAVFVAGVPPGSESGLVIVGLFLNGVGWNLAFVAGSALLTDALSPDERTSVQGLADLVMGLMGALGSAVGGMVLGAWGFAALNALGGGVVCGGLAADPLAVPILIGLGVRELSVPPVRISATKTLVRQLTVSACRPLAAEALTLDSAAAVRASAVDHD